MLKKFLVTAVVLALSLSILSPLSAVKASSVAETEVSETGVSPEDLENATLTAEELDSLMREYIQLQEDGTVAFKEDIPENVYNAYNFDALQNHLDSINLEVKNKKISINEDLTINDLSMMARSSVYGKWTYHVWGYDRKFNNSQTKAYVDRLEYQAIGATMVTGVGAYFPPVAGIAGLSAGYWALLAKRVEANNKGKGVYVAVTWVNIFNVKPL